MRHLAKVSFTCFALVGALELLTAVRFLSASRIMDYHQVAMGAAWDALALGVQVMTLNFMRAAGLGFLLTGIAFVFLLVFPFRHGHAWTRWALACFGVVQSVVMGWIIISVRTHTPAVPPLAPFVATAILSITGFLTYRQIVTEKPTPGGTR